MSYPYPRDRHRDRKEKGEAPLKVARQVLAQPDAAIQRAAAGGGPGHDESPEEHVERLRAETAARLSRIARDGEQDRDDRDAGTESADRRSGG